MTKLSSLVESAEDTPSTDVQSKPGPGELKENMMCFYCKKKGHIVKTCPVLIKKKTQSVAFIQTKRIKNHFGFEKTCGYADFKLFVMDGFVSVSGSSERIPVKILRDTATSQSFILEGILPLNADTAVGSKVPVRGFNMEQIEVPLHRVLIQSDLWSGDAIVGERPCFPIHGVSLIMGNDLDGGRILVTPEVTAVPLLCTGSDKRARVRTFKPGDKVLVLLPNPGSSLQVRYSGPYFIQKKVGDRNYLVATPDRRRRSWWCHVNRLKAYVEHAPSRSCARSVSDPGENDTPEPRISLSMDMQEELSSPEEKRVGGGQVRPVEDKVEAISSVRLPVNRTELRRYRAMVGYYRGFCKNFSAVASLLTDH